MENDDERILLSNFKDSELKQTIKNKKVDTNIQKREDAL